MAIKKFCDKCKGEVTRDNNVQVVASPEWSAVGNCDNDEDNYEQETFDLCKGCFGIIKSVIEHELVLTNVLPGNKPTVVFQGERRQKDRPKPPPARYIPEGSK